MKYCINTTGIFALSEIFKTIFNEKTFFHSFLMLIFSGLDDICYFHLFIVSSLSPCALA